MEKYFKRKNSRFDQIDYIADLYKLIQGNLVDIRKQINQYQKQIDQDGKDNLNKLLADKHSLLNELKKDKSTIDIEGIKTSTVSMLENLRFQDGRSLREVVEQQRLENKIATQEAMVAYVKNWNKNSDSDENKKTEVVEENKDSFLDYDDEDNSENEYNDDKLHGAVSANPMLYADLLKTREEQKKRRQEFATSLDENLSEEQRVESLKKYDSQVTSMETNLLQEQELQSTNLKARIAARQRKVRGAIDEVNVVTKDQQEEVRLLNGKILEINKTKEQIETEGIDTKKLKRERAMGL